MSSQRRKLLFGGVQQNGQVLSQGICMRLPTQHESGGLCAFDTDTITISAMDAKGQS